MVHLGQDDNVREVLVNLLADGVPYDITADAPSGSFVFTVKYIKANGVPGEYATTSTGLDAVTKVDNTVNQYIVRLDEHATDVPGFAEAFLTMYETTGTPKVLHSFPITIDVVRTTTDGTDPRAPYYNGTPYLVKAKQAAKTSAMTQAVGVDSNGALWTTPAAAETFWVSITRVGNVYSSDKTLTEIQTAVSGGAVVRAHLPDGFEADYTNNDSGAMFYAVDTSGGEPMIMRYTVGSSSVTFESWPVGGTSVDVDPTLSVEGDAADAKATGDAIAGITSLDALFGGEPPEVPKTYFAGEWVVGGLRNGQHVTNNDRIHSVNIMSYETDTTWFLNLPYKFALHTFDANDTFLADSGWLTGVPAATGYTIPAGTRFKWLIGDSTDHEMLYEQVYQLGTPTGGGGGNTQVDQFRQVLLDLFTYAAYKDATGSQYVAQLRGLLSPTRDLPEDYTRHDYVQMAQKAPCFLRLPLQTIDDIQPYKFTIECAFLTERAFVFGASNTVDGTDYEATLEVGLTTNNSVEINYLGLKTNALAAPETIDITQKTKIVLHNGMVTVNDTWRPYHSGGTDFSGGTAHKLKGGVPLGVGGRSKATSSGWAAMTSGGDGANKIYGIIIEDPNGQTLVHLVPCVNALNQVGFYDLATGHFYYGGASAVAGDDET